MQEVMEILQVNNDCVKGVFSLNKYLSFMLLPFPSSNLPEKFDIFIIYSLHQLEGGDS